MMSKHKQLTIFDCHKKRKEDYCYISSTIDYSSTELEQESACENYDSGQEQLINQ